MFVFRVKDSSGDVDEGRGLAVGSGEGGKVSALGAEAGNEEGDVGDFGESIRVGIGESDH